MLLHAETFDVDGLRRSKRRHYPPLEYWRQEKVVWGRRENGRSVVPVIKEIITIPKPVPEPLRGKKRKRAGTHAPRSKSRTAASPNLVEEVRVVEVDNPELGWDNNTHSNGIILDWYSKTEVERRELLMCHVDLITINDLVCRCGLYRKNDYSQSRSG